MKHRGFCPLSDAISRLKNNLCWVILYVGLFCFFKTYYLPLPLGAFDGDWIDGQIIAFKIERI